jgi:hypothetical protein
MVYDASTGELRDDRKHMSMLEDFWLPRREGGKGTEITTLPAGQNLGELEDVKYFQKKLLNSLNVPLSRLDEQTGGGFAGLGRSQEITRDELKFAKFIQRLRNKFSQMFTEALGLQLILKGICTSEEWNDFKELIIYDFKKDNNFTELRESELLQNRLQMVGMVDPYIGKYFSHEFVKKKILQMTDEEISDMQKQIDQEDEQGLGGPTMGQAEPPPPSPDEYPPVDNTIDDRNSESPTPELDAETDRYSSILNRR